MNPRAVYRSIYQRAVNRPPLPGYVRYKKALLTPKEHWFALWMRTKFEKGEALAKAHQELVLASWGKELTPGQRAIYDRSLRYEAPAPRNKKPWTKPMGGPNNPHWGHRLSEETKQVLRAQKVGKLNPIWGTKRPDSVKQAVSNELRGVKKTEIHKQNMRANWYTRKHYQCEACGAIVPKANLRHHGANCRHVGE